MGSPSKSRSAVMCIEVIPVGKSIFMPLCLFTSRRNVVFQFPFISFQQAVAWLFVHWYEDLNPRQAQHQKPSGCVAAASWYIQKSLD